MIVQVRRKTALVRARNDLRPRIGAAPWARGADRWPTRTGALGLPSLPDGPAGPGPKPLKQEPTIVTKADITDYLRIIVNLMKSLNTDDLLAHTVYRDPEIDQKQVEILLGEAQALDGCESGLTCPGWQESDPTPIAPKDVLAATYRKQAFQHRVDARFMEDRIAARGMSNAAVQTEVALWNQWLVYKEKVKGYLTSLEGFTVVKSSDFSEAQRLDLELQQFRARYTAATGLEPTMPLTPTPPFSSFPWGWLVAGVVIIAGAIILGPAIGTLATRAVAP